MLFKRSRTLLALITIAVALSAVHSAAQQFTIPPGMPELKGPILITPCGQSPGGVYVKVICRQIKIEADLEDDAKVETLSAKPYKTLMIITGTSLKGMGSAGVELDDEIARCEAVVKKAKSMGMKVIVAQIEGTSRRVDDSDERSIRSMTPLGDVLITHKDINADGYFTKSAAEKHIPQIFIAQQLDLLKLFPLIFKI